MNCWAKMRDINPELAGEKPDPEIYGVESRDSWKRKRDAEAAARARAMAGFNDGFSEAMEGEVTS